MIRYRSFQNTDPALIAELWRSSFSGHGVMQPMSATLLEYFAFSKPYFAYDGLILAFDEDQEDLIVGFGHAGFGPLPDRSQLDLETGIISLMMVRPEYRRQGIGTELLNQLEGYLQTCGSQVIYAGGFKPFEPFYLGIYGGSELPGTLESLPDAGDFFRTQGYQEEERIQVLECELARFRPPIDRRQIALRRSSIIELVYDPIPSDWWDACTFCHFERVRFEIFDNQSNECMGSVTLWMMEPLAHSWNVRAVGLIDLEIEESFRQQGVATYLVGEALRRLGEQGIWMVQAQVPTGNTVALKLFEKLGFTQKDAGLIFAKH
ncbi:GNAT family N-acetyltransferase [Planctomycetales bacterium 10988]|nr:GNAT family N-acetyltransferase [Planctomycetales bacterium 10988]